MDPFTLLDIKNGVRGLLQDDAFDEDLIAQAANWSVFELFSSYRLRMAETSDTLSALSGATELEFPADLLTRIDIYVTSPQVYKMDRPLEYETFMSSYANFATATAQQARAWTEYGLGMRFAGPLNAAHTFQIDYLRTPEKMESDSDECEIPGIYEELVNKMTLARIMEINEDYAEARQERDNYSSLLTTFVRNEGRGGGKVGPAAVMRTNRMRGAFRPDRDM